MSEITLKSPIRVVPVTMEIKQFFHCSKCLDSIPSGMSPREWADLSVGLTSYGIQVWCHRHHGNVVHVDFLGQRLPANTATRAK